jgi:hypothetical protein
MIDLFKNKYDRQTLKEHIYAVRLIDILKTQTIDVTFAVRYILNKNYQIHEEDEKINFTTVLKYQKHISLNDLLSCWQEYESDDDSIDDFETISNRI